jgi:hypothetical protein
MRRWTFHLLAGVSFLLLLATLAMWVMSYGAGSQIIRTRNFAKRNEKSEYALLLVHGSFLYVQDWIDSGFASSGKREVVHWEWENVRPGFAEAWSSERLPHHFAGFGYELRSSLPSESYTRRLRIVCVPAWSQLLLLAIIPACWVIRQLRARCGLRQGHCLHCGYDLRASPDRCPECGRPVPVPPATMASADPNAS